MDDRANEPETSAAEWRQMYFLGLSKRPLDQIKPDEAQVGGLLSVIGLTAVISSGTAIEPQYLINEKGTTPWLAMYALVRTNDPEALALIADGRTRIHVPPGFLDAAFGSHVNWPEAVIEKYDLALGEYKLFAIPFLVHNKTSMGGLSQSMKAPDGSLEIFGVHEFIEGDPEDLLREFAGLASFIREERRDAIQ